jgi:hypothetical protein
VPAYSVLHASLDSRFTSLVGLESYYKSSIIKFSFYTESGPTCAPLHLVVFLPGFQKGREGKGQGYQGFLRKRAGISRQGAVLAKKRAICVIQGKTCVFSS